MPRCFLQCFDFEKLQAAARKDAQLNGPEADAFLGSFGSLVLKFCGGTCSRGILLLQAAGAAQEDASSDSQIQQMVPQMVQSLVAFLFLGVFLAIFGQLVPRFLFSGKLMPARHNRRLGLEFGARNQSDTQQETTCFYAKNHSNMMFACSRLVK